MSGKNIPPTYHLAVVVQKKFSRESGTSKVVSEPDCFVQVSYSCSIRLEDLNVTECFVASILTNQYSIIFSYRCDKVALEQKVTPKRKQMKQC